MSALKEQLIGADRTAGGVSFLDLFMQAHVVVKVVMFGLLAASVWSWAIIVEKLFAFRRARIEADRFEQLFWSGQSLEELYTSLSRGRTIAMAALFVAAMREWKRSVEGNIRALGGIQLRVEKVMDVTISREMERLDRRLLFLAHRRLDGAVRRPVRHGVGHHDELPGHRRLQEYEPRCRRAGHRGSAVCDRARAARGDPRGDRLQQVLGRFGAHQRSGSRRSPTSSRPSYRARSTCGPETRIAMGASLNIGQARRPARPSRARHAPMSEINVTPFVDVMLVLLIIFMVAAPLLTVGVPLDLPQAKGKQLEANKEPLVVSVTGERRGLPRPGGEARR